MIAKTLNPERLAKLPKWAQDHIHILNMDVRRLKARIDAEEDRDTEVWLQEWEDGDKPLPARSRVAFKPKNGGELVIYVNGDSTGIEVYESGLGGGLYISPSASNVVVIRGGKLR
jgi:hypothetical protein